MNNRLLAGAAAVVAAGGAVTYVVVRRRRAQHVAELTEPGEATLAEQAARDAEAAQASAVKGTVDTRRLTRRSPSFRMMRPATLALASQIVRFADNHETDVIDLVTLILTRNQANPNPKDPTARRQAEIIVSQTLAALKLLTDRGQSEPTPSDATAGAAPA
ncbi:MAG: hypothetical protein KIS91_08275 [Anaerolineae bacterium]|nr:hypothetical protein [Anaerolineae bacterium]